MKHRMNKGARTWLMVVVILATLIVVAILATLWATSRFEVPPSFFQRRWPPPNEIPEDIELFYTVKTVVSAVNVTLLIFLLLT